MGRTLKETKANEEAAVARAIREQALWREERLRQQRRPIEEEIRRLIGLVVVLQRRGVAQDVLQQTQERVKTLQAAWAALV
jgi:hypothetical protein